MTPPTTRRPDAPPRGHSLLGDAIGLALAAGLAAWILVAAERSGGSAAGPLGLLLGVVVAYGIGRLVASRWIAAPVVAIVAGAAILFVASWAELSGDNPLAAPLGYQNANAAFFVQALAAAVTLLGHEQIVVVRGLAAVASLTFMAVPFITGSSAAGVSSLLVLIVGSLVFLGWWRPWMLAAIVAGLLAVLLGTMLLGASYSTRPEDRPACRGGLTETRLALWHDAIDLTVHHPVTGVGAGRFAEASPVAAADPDRRHAHQEYLETAAESGVLGGLLLVCLVVWVTVRTGIGGGIRATIAAAAVAALGIHASVDYILHFPSIPTTSAGLAGAASAEGRAIASRIRTHLTPARGADD